MFTTFSQASSSPPRQLHLGDAKPRSDPGETTSPALLNPGLLSDHHFPILGSPRSAIGPSANLANTVQLHGSKEASASSDNEDDWTLVFTINSKGKKSPPIGGSLNINFQPKLPTRTVRNIFEVPGMDLTTDEPDISVTEDDDAKLAAALAQPPATTHTVSHSALRPEVTSACQDATVVLPTNSSTDESYAVSQRRRSSTTKPPRAQRNRIIPPSLSHEALEEAILEHKFELMRLRTELGKVTPLGNPETEHIAPASVPSIPVDCNYITTADRELAHDLFTTEYAHFENGATNHRRTFGGSAPSRKTSTRRRKRNHARRRDDTHKSVPPTKPKPPPRPTCDPRAAPAIIKQVQRFDQTVDAVMNTDAFAHLPHDERHLLITEFVLKNEPPIQGTNQMSALLQGLMRKGMRNGTMKPATIATLWAHSGGKIEDTPFGFEYILQERSKAHNRPTDPRRHHSCSDTWGKPRPQLRYPRHRGQSPSAPPSAPKSFWSQQTRDNFSRLIDSHLPPQPIPFENCRSNATEEPEWLEHHCCAAAASSTPTSEDENDQSDAAQTPASRHDPDPDYVPSPPSPPDVSNPTSPAPGTSPRRTPFDEASLDDTAFTCVEFEVTEPELVQDLKDKLLRTQSQLDTLSDRKTAVKLALQQFDTLDDELLRPPTGVIARTPPRPSGTSATAKSTAHTKNTARAQPADAHTLTRESFGAQLEKLLESYGKSKRRSSIRFADDDDDNDHSNNSDDSSKAAAITVLHYDNEHGSDADWHLFRRNRIASLRPAIESKQGKAVSNSASKIYDRLTKKAFQLKVPTLHYETDQTKRATSYRRWITSLYHVLLHNPFARALVDSKTFEINQDAQFPLADLEGVAMFIMSKVGERMRAYLHDIDLFDPVATLFALQQYCMPNSPSVRNQLFTEIQSFRIRDNETGTQYIARFNQKIEHAFVYNVRFDSSKLVDILLDGFHFCSQPLHRRYEAPISQLRMQRTKEANARAGSIVSHLTIRDIENDIDQIDLRYSHSSSSRSTRSPVAASGGDSDRPTDRPNNDRNRDRTTRRFRPGDRNRNYSHLANQVDRARVATKRPTIKCYKCGGPHHLNLCPKIKDPSEKNEIWAKFYEDNPSVKPRSSHSSTPTKSAAASSSSSAPLPIRQQTPSLKKTPKYTEQGQFCVKNDDNYSHHASAVSHSDEYPPALTPNGHASERADPEISNSIPLQFPNLNIPSTTPWYEDDDVPTLEQEIRFQYWLHRQQNSTNLTLDPSTYIREGHNA